MHRTRYYKTQTTNEAARAPARPGRAVHFRFSVLFAFRPHTRCRHTRCNHSLHLASHRRFLARANTFSGSFSSSRACLTDARFTCLVHSLFRALPVPRPPCPPAPSLSRALPTLSHMWDEQGPPASAGVKERSPERGMMHRARAQILAADLEEITCHGSSP